MRRDTSPGWLVALDEVAKRGFDLAVAGVALLLLWPVLLALAALVRLDSPGPALYIPPMVGKGGRLFPLLRFRTMAVAEGRRGQAMSTTSGKLPISHQLICFHRR